MPPAVRHADRDLRDAIAAQLAGEFDPWLRTSAFRWEVEALEQEGSFVEHWRFHDAR